jgi:hypothetical protein
MPTIDRKPERPHPIKLAAGLLNTELTCAAHAAAIIRDLYDLAKAQDKLLVAYRVGKQPSGKVLDTISRLKQVTIDAPGFG